MLDTVEEMFAKMVEHSRVQAEQSRVQAEQIRAQQAQLAEQTRVHQEALAELIGTIKIMPGIANPVAVQIQPAVIAPAVVRADKICKLSMGMRKSNRLKMFKAGDDSDESNTSKPYNCLPSLLPVKVPEA